jgi:hypothetical protein
MHTITITDGDVTRYVRTVDNINMAELTPAIDAVLNKPQPKRRKARPDKGKARVAAVSARVE